MTRQVIRLLAVLAAGSAWAPSAVAAQQATVSTHWHVAAVQAEAFGESDWGLALGATRGLYNGASLVAGAGIDIAWTRPALSGSRAPGTPLHRDLYTVDAHLRKRLLLLPGGIGFEAGLPIGMVWSRIGESSATASGSALPTNEEPGGRVGATAGGLAALRAPLGRRVSVLAEARALHAWIYGQREWLEAYRVGVAVRF